jgi:hypothetical protein
MVARPVGRMMGDTYLPTSHASTTPAREAGKTKPGHALNGAEKPLRADTPGYPHPYPKKQARGLEGI